MFVWAHALRVQPTMVEGACWQDLAVLSLQSADREIECWCSPDFLSLPFFIQSGTQYVDWMLLSTFRVGPLLSVKLSGSAPGVQILPDVS